MSFQEIVEQVRHLPREQVEELQVIISEQLWDFPEGPGFDANAEEQLMESHHDAMRDYREGRLDPPSSDVNELMRQLRGK
jgi:hypothetical protein